MGWFLLAAQGK